MENQDCQVKCLSFWFLVYGLIFSLVCFKALAQLQLIDYIGEQTAVLIKVSICSRNIFYSLWGDFTRNLYLQGLSVFPWCSTH